MPIPDKAAVTAALDAMFNSPTSVKKTADPKKGPNWCAHCEVNHHKNTKCPWKQTQDNGDATPEPPPAEVKQQPPSGVFKPDSDKPLSGALTAVGLWPTSVAGKGLQILSESGGTPMTIEEIVSKGNLVLPASYAVSIDKVLKNKLTQLVSHGYVKKVGDGYTWAGKWDSPAGTGTGDPSATPMPQHKPAEPAASPPTPQAKALKDFIGQIKDHASFSPSPENVDDIIKMLPSMALQSPLGVMTAIRNILQAGDPGSLPGGGFPLAKEIYDQLTMKDVLKATGTSSHQVNLDAMPVNPWDVAEAFDDKPALSSLIEMPMNAGNKVLTPIQKAHVAQALAKLFKVDASPIGLAILKAIKNSSPGFGLADGKQLFEGLQADGVLVSQGGGEGSLGSHMSLADTPTGKCPDGHSTFKTPVPHNCPSCGKVMQPQASTNTDTQPADGLISKLQDAFPTAYGSELTTLSNMLGAIKASPSGKPIDFIVDALSGAVMQGADPHEWIESLEDNGFITVDNNGICHATAQQSDSSSAQKMSDLKSKIKDSFPYAGSASLATIGDVLSKVTSAGINFDALVDKLMDAGMSYNGAGEWAQHLSEKHIITVDSNNNCHLTDGAVTDQVPEKASVSLSSKLVTDYPNATPELLSQLNDVLSDIPPNGISSAHKLTLQLVEAGIPLPSAKMWTKALSESSIVTIDSNGICHLAPGITVTPPPPAADTSTNQLPSAEAVEKVTQYLDAFPYLTATENAHAANILCNIKTPKSVYEIKTELQELGLSQAKIDKIYNNMMQHGEIVPVPGQQGMYQLSDLLKGMVGIQVTPPAATGSPSMSVAVPSSTEVATALGWNESGKGIGLLQALNAAGDAGQTLDEAVQGFAAKSGNPPPAKGLAAKILDAAIEKGFVKRIPGTKPPKWIFATGLPASAMANVPPAPATASPFVPGPPKQFVQAISDQLDSLNLPHQLKVKAIDALQTSNPIQSLQFSGLPEENVFEISQLMLQCGLLKPGQYWPQPLGNGAQVTATGKCPNGHTTYKNPVPDTCPTCHTPMDGAAHAPAGASTIPKTIDQIPDGKTLQLIGDAHGQVGGIKEKEFYKDPATGQKYLFKPDTDGYTKHVRPAAAQACAAIGAAILGPDAVIPVKADVNAQGVHGSFQPWQDAKGDANILNMKALTPAQKSQLQNERVFDWLTANHDTKKENFIVLKDGRIVGIDKEQGFKWVGQDKLSTSYKPNQGVPIYNELYKDYAAKKIDLDPMEIKGTLDRIDAMSDSTYLALIEPYVAANAKEFGWSEAKKEEKRQAILTRKHETRSDMEKFYNELRAQRGEPSISFGPSMTSHHAQIVSNILPPLGSMKKAGSAAALGGAKKDKVYVVSKLDGGKFLFKPAKEQFRAYVQQVVSDLSRHICTIDRDFAVVQAGCLADGTLGAMQTLLPRKANLKGTPIKKLSKTQLADLQAERVLDWAVSNHDSHGSNLIFLQNGMIAGVDKEQAFRYIGSDKLSLSYHPNKTYQEEPPVYNEMYTLYAQKKLALDPNDCLPAIQNIEKTADSVWMDIVEPYVISVAKAGKTRSALRAAILGRKHSIRSDFRDFFIVLNAMRGEPKTFTFADETP